MRTLHLYRLSQWDGGDRTIDTPYFFESEAAGEAQKGPHDRLQPVQIIILEEGDSLKVAEQKARAMQALAKLTPFEREAIGLPSDLGEAIRKVTGSSA